METLKFRAWIHRDCGGYIPLECYETMDYSDNYQNDLSEFFGLYNPLFFDVMQFTGLHDKNGKEIYEGDIITCEVYTREEYDEFLSGRPIKVVFEDGSFYPFAYKFGWRSSVEEIEIIGNIHQSPELLNQK